MHDRPRAIHPEGRVGNVDLVTAGSQVDSGIAAGLSDLELYTQVKVMEFALGVARTGTTIRIFFQSYHAVLDRHLSSAFNDPAFLTVVLEERDKSVGFLRFFRTR